MSYVGNKWYKCDFHLHTMQSNCYRNKRDTAVEWVKEIRDKRIDCIAITDHNDYRKINEIKKECEKYGIVAFPGVEVTCDTSKIHILILFSEKSDENVVRDFLTIIGIDSSVIDGDEKSTNKSVFEVCKTARERGGVVIAAHVDEYNGLGSMSDANLKKLINGGYLDAIQVKNSEIWERKEDMSEQLLLIKKKYGDKIEESEVKKWKKVYTKINKSKLPILAFSDNPASENDSEHGLWGIGKEYTWVKMGEIATLEGFVQALLSYDLRIKTSKVCKDMPENMPSFWIKSMTIINSVLNNDKEIEVEFNPHLNTIIGGRGSGKSSIIRLLCGAFKSKDIINLKNITKDQDDFYKKRDKEGRGVFNNNSKIEINFMNDDIEYCMSISEIDNQQKQNRELYIIRNDEKIPVENSILDICDIQVYPQKSIYEIAKSPDDLLNVIDSEIEGMTILKDNYRKCYDELLHKKEDKRNIEKIIEQETAIKNNILNLQNKIDYYNKNGLKDIIVKRQNIINDNELVNKIVTDINNYNFDCVNEFEEIINGIEYDRISDEEIRTVTKRTLNTIGSRVDNIKDIINAILVDIHGIKEFVDSSEWQKKINNINNEYNDFVKEQGIEITDINNLIEKKSIQTQNLTEVSNNKKKLSRINIEINNVHKECKSCMEEIRKRRNQFIGGILNDNSNIRVSIDKEGNREKFCNSIKNIIQKDNITIIEDIGNIADKVFKEKSISIFRNIVSQIRNGNENNELSKIFHKTIIELDDELIDKLLTYELEDKLVFEYKPTSGKKYRTLNVASAGQKAAAILTFIASYGDKPLLLDQPEDDLDNKMVYELVVRMLQKSKQKRQLIIATHNANIPVNGDAEYIIAMQSDRVNVNVGCKGTIDNEEMRNEICDVMEGTKYAFEMRAKKYHMNITN